VYFGPALQELIHAAVPLGVSHTVRINDGEDMRPPRVYFALDEPILFRKKVNHRARRRSGDDCFLYWRQCDRRWKRRPSMSKGGAIARRHGSFRLSDSTMAVCGRRSNRECEPYMLRTGTG
jgi:hypothetical protein